MNRAWKTAYWVVPPLLCLGLYWHGFTAWFRGDDFAWLGLWGRVHSFHDLLLSLFAPRAQGTLRPLSERAFFMVGMGLFGLNAVPFRVVIFATQFANVVLVASIGARLTGRRAAGFVAAVLWTINSGLAETLGWVCVYNEVLCGLCLLLAFHFLLRQIETGRKSYGIYQWLVFLVGFGVLELIVVYPVLAAGYTLLCARQHFRRTLPLFIPSVVYAVLHSAVAPLPQTGYYAMHFDTSILATLVKLWSWSVAAVYLQSPMQLPEWVMPAGAAVISAGLLAFAGWQARRARWVACFFLLWYSAIIAPVLPLRDHTVEYYIYLPTIGLCWLGGWALVTAWRAGSASRWGAAAVAALYAFLTVPAGWAASEWSQALTIRARNLMEGVAGAHQLHPDQAILLYGVDSDLFANAIAHRLFRLIGIEDVYLTPGSERLIQGDPRVGEFVLAGDAATRALAAKKVVVYDIRGPRLRNMTSVYSALPREGSLPLQVDVSNPLDAYLLGPEWYANEGGHRWMPKRATLRMGVPVLAGRRLYLEGQCSDEQLREGPLTVTVTVNGSTLPPASLARGQTSFELAFALPGSVVAQGEMKVEVEVERTFRPAGDGRDLGLAFGLFEVR